jgi:hypothetical protein
LVANSYTDNQSLNRFSCQKVTVCRDIIEKLE